MNHLICMQIRPKLILAVLASSLLAGCASTVTAPVRDVGGAAAVAEPLARPGVHVVRPGDTLLGIARQYGVTVAFGTDAGVYQHGRNAEELGLMKKQGMTDREVLASATTVAAKVLGMENQIGRLAPGYSADIIAVGGNPLADVTVLEKVDFVMVRGRVIE